MGVGSVDPDPCWGIVCAGRVVIVVVIVVLVCLFVVGEVFVCGVFCFY